MAMREEHGFLISDAPPTQPKCPTCGKKVNGISDYVKHKKAQHGDTK